MHGGYILLFSVFLFMMFILVVPLVFLTLSNSSTSRDLGDIDRDADRTREIRVETGGSYEPFRQPELQENALIGATESFSLHNYTKGFRVPPFRFFSTIDYEVNEHGIRLEPGVYHIVVKYLHQKAIGGDSIRDRLILTHRPRYSHGTLVQNVVKTNVSKYDEHKVATSQFLGIRIAQNELMRVESALDFMYTREKCMNRIEMLIWKVDS